MFLIFFPNNVAELKGFYFEPLVMQCWTYGEHGFLDHSSRFRLALFPKSLSDTFCNGGCLVHFLSKFVSRPLIQPASHSPSSDLYYLAFPKDPLTTKILVYAVYAIELTQTILFSKMAFQELAAGFGRFEALNEAGNFWFSVPILSSTGVFSFRLFFGHRPFACLREN